MATVTFRPESQKSNVPGQYSSQLANLRLQPNYTVVGSEYWCVLNPVYDSEQAKCVLTSSLPAAVSK